jgi:hypothetical protein
MYASTVTRPGYNRRRPTRSPKTHLHGLNSESARPGQGGRARLGRQLSRGFRVARMNGFSCLLALAGTTFFLTIPSLPPNPSRISLSRPDVMHRARETGTSRAGDLHRNPPLGEPGLFLEPQVRGKTSLPPRRHRTVLEGGPRKMSRAR